MIEFADYTEAPDQAAACYQAMNWPQDSAELHVTRWENIEAATKGAAGYGRMGLHLRD